MFTHNGREKRSRIAVKSGVRPRFLELALVARVEQRHRLYVF